MSASVAAANREERVSVADPVVVSPGQPSEQLEVGVGDVNVPAEAAEDESQYPTGLTLVFIVLSAALVLILACMDATIVAVAVPALTNHFHTVQDVGWYYAAYRLCSCSFQFMFGKLYKIFSVKRIFFTSVVIFMAGTVLCAAAQQSAVFVLGRAICGFANAGIESGCFTLLVYCIPMRKRAMYTGILVIVASVASIAGPMLGGVIVDQLNWQWCFWIGLPLGFVTLVGVYFCLPEMKPQPEVQRTWRQLISELDLIGNALFVPSLTCLFIALSWAGTKYAWNSPTVISLFCTFGVLLGLFGLEQYRKGDAATLPPRIFCNRTVLAGLVYSLFGNAATMVIIYYLPTYYQTVRQYSAAKSGYLQFPLVAGDMIGSIVQAVGVSVGGYYTPYMLAGSVFLAVFSGLLTTLTVNTALAKILVLTAFYGFGGGIGYQSPQAAVQVVLPKSDCSIALAVILFGQQFGPAVFVSTAQSIFQNRLADNLHDLAPSLNTTGVEAMGLSDLKTIITPEKLNDVLIGIDRSLSQTWYLAVALACVTMLGSAAMDWGSVKKAKVR